MKNFPGKISSGKPFPLGATCDGEGVNFALFSINASAVKLCLFNDIHSRVENIQININEKTGHVWHIYLHGLKPGQLYGYRVYGKYNPSAGFRFNPYKLLLDPYAKAITKPLNINEKMFDYPVHEADRNKYLKKDIRNSADVSARSVVIDPSFDWEGIEKPQTPFHKSIIYELHVKGFTALHPGIPENERGTYKALSYPFIIDYFKKLGVTALELMPVHHFLHSKFLIDKGLSEYWGYNSIGFFAPHSGYSSSGSMGEQISEFKEMVKAYHREGLEVILDVVYNHTVEGNSDGPSVCFRGIDNQSYYRLSEKHKRFYTDFTGTGNTLNLSNSCTLKLVMDSLRYWAVEMQVDGFRFDLAQALVRGNENFTSYTSFLDTIHQDAVLSKLKLIAEPWDYSEEGNIIGIFPELWSEWNGFYRDTIRKFWRRDDVPLNDFAESIAGSSGLFRLKGMGTSASINYITSHDGFTLHDLVSYNNKRNKNNLEDNKDGSNNNLSWNFGKSGSTFDKKMMSLRHKQKCNFMATLLFSQGIPMISHGDEYGRSQSGNNNAYCQDNEISWFRWKWSEQEVKFFEFVKKVIELRKNHPLLRKRDYFKIKRKKEISEIQWLKPDGSEFSNDELINDLAACFGLFLIGEEPNEVDESGNKIKNDSLLLLFNNQIEPVNFIFPNILSYNEWQVLIDTSMESIPENIQVKIRYEIGSQSLVLLHRILV